MKLVFSKKYYFLFFIYINFIYLSYQERNSAETRALADNIPSSVDSTLLTINLTDSTVNSTLEGVTRKVRGLATTILGNQSDQIIGLMDILNGTSETDPSDLVLYRKSINLMPLISIPSLSNYSSWNSTALDNDFQQAFGRVMGEYTLYFLNNCTDYRVPSLFGDAMGTPEAYFDCMDLASEFMQVYAPYKCNDFFCNMQGNCSFTIDDQKSVIPSCSCNSGFTGSTCMYNISTYSNADLWITFTKNWLDNYIISQTNNGIITDAKVISDFIDIVQQILLFSSNAIQNDINKYGNYISAYSKAIMNSKVPMNTDLEQKLYEFIDFIISNIDGNLQGVNPTQLIGMTNDNIKVSDDYAIQKVDIPTDKELNLSPIDAVSKTSGSSSKLRFLQNLNFNFKKYKNNYNLYRSLQTSKTNIPSKPTQKKTINPDSAKATLPQNVTSALINSSVTFVIFKDPSSMTQINSVAISSQVINIRVVNKITNALVPYPSGVGSYQLYLPWTQVPYNILNNQYKINCKVYYFDQKTWVETKSCTILDTTNSNVANIDCKTFGTFGVSCAGATVVAKKSTSSGYISLFSYLFYAILGLI